MAHILLLESADFSRQKNKYLFTEAGHSVVSRKSAEEAYKLIDANKIFDLIIIDSQISDADCIKVVQNIKAKFPKQKLVFTYSNQDLQIAEKALSHGANAIFAKPLNAESVESLLQKVNI